MPIVNKKQTTTSMKRIIFSVIIGAAVCTAALAGYKAHERNNMSPQEILAMKNLEVLTHEEDTSNCSHASGSPIYNYLYNGCYYDGYRCFNCGQIVLYGGSVRCLGR
jgi:hypothetical protein